MGKKLTTEEFIEKAKKVHGDKYDYSKVEYINSRTKVCIICPIHGEFYIKPIEHTKGRGCMRCAEENQVQELANKEMEFIKKSQQIHNDYYDYSKVAYISYHTKVCIICPKHGEFWQKPSKHLIGQGCPMCAKLKYSHFFQPYTTESFIEKAKQVHGDKYDYSKVEYVNNRTKVCIICPKHGEFWQIPSEHLYGYGCRKCADEKYIMGKTSFIQKARKVHGDKYDYSKVDYIQSTMKVCIICPIHGEFWQSPRVHLRHRGCPLCTNNQHLTTENFIKKSRNIHGNQYDYRKVDYINNHTKVIVTCPIHGDFDVQPSQHLSGSICPVCAKLKNVLETKLYEHITQKFSEIEWIHSYHNYEKLGRLELDMFNPQYNIAIEYQGKQHFEPVEFFGGESHFEKQQYRDMTKIQFCGEHNIRLFHFSYDTNCTKYDMPYKLYTDENELFLEIEQIIKETK